MVLIQLLLPTSSAAGADGLAPLAETRRELAGTIQRLLDQGNQRTNHSRSSTVASSSIGLVDAQTALCRTHVLLEALGETMEWSQCATCDNCRGLAVRSAGVAVGAA